MSSTTHCPFFFKHSSCISRFALSLPNSVLVPYYYSIGTGSIFCASKIGLSVQCCSGFARFLDARFNIGASTRVFCRTRSDHGLLGELGWRKEVVW